MMQCCIIEGKKFSILSKEEKGIFLKLIQETYIFQQDIFTVLSVISFCANMLWKMKVLDILHSHSLHFVLGEEDSDEEGELQTVVYFWQASYINSIIVIAMLDIDLLNRVKMLVTWDGYSLH